MSSRAFGDCLWPSLSLVGKKDKVCCQSWLLDSEWVLQRHPVRDCSHCLACTVELFLQVRFSWAQSPSPDCCRLLTGDDGLLRSFNLRLPYLKSGSLDFLFIIVFSWPLGMHFVKLSPKMFLLKIQIFSTIFHVITVTFCREKRSSFSSFQEGKTANTSVFSFLVVPPTGRSRTSQLAWLQFLHLLLISSKPPARKTRKILPLQDERWFSLSHRWKVAYTHPLHWDKHKAGARHRLPFLRGDIAKRWICRHFGFAMATGGRKPAACSKMFIFSHLVNFGHNFPSSLVRWPNGLGTAWPGREPDVKRPESLRVSSCWFF